MKTEDFHFDLPEELIAQYPLENRSRSRLLCLQHGIIKDRYFTDIIKLLNPEDILVFNNTKVIPARLYGNKSTGGKLECLVERITSETSALVHLKASKSPKPGARLEFNDGLTASVLGREGGLFKLQFNQPLLQALNQQGHIPLPPYISREDADTDWERYQTVYAEKPGAVAAPTAGLHFDKALLQAIADKGISSAFVTLHVGAGTFQPVRVTDITDHQMHSEYVEIDQASVDSINSTRQQGGRVIAVGTTSVRTLETASQSGELKEYAGDTDIFIYPGYQFKTVDAMITNFHLPESTLLMLVSAFVGYDNIMRAYQHAVAQQYRFFSYGDAMFLQP